MKILSKDELLIAEGVLLKHLPNSLMILGFIHGINRQQPTTLQVVVDTWPDFNVILCRPDPQNKRALESRKQVTYYTRDEDVLRRILTEENVVDWSTYFTFAGFDFSHAPLLQQVSSDRGINSKCHAVTYPMYLPDSSQLQTSAISSELESRISSLDLSHVDLVNNTWKFGGSKRTSMIIKNLICNFPSCCITDGQGQPVSWILVYEYWAMGMLYTLPEHRGKGYAKVIINAMVQKLRAEGSPVYCFIEEENMASCNLFKSLGFVEASYKAAWIGFNF